MRSNSTVVPSSLLRDCLVAVDSENISLRLQSRLMLAVVNSLLSHYKNILTDVLNKVSNSPNSPVKQFGSRMSSKVTYEIDMDVLCNIIIQGHNEYPDEIECVRGRLSGMSGYDSGHVNSSGPGSIVSMMNNDLLPAGYERVGTEHISTKRPKIDRSIDISPEIISKRDKIDSVRWFSGLISSLLSEEYSEIVGDISSIEAVRRHSSDRSANSGLLVESISGRMDNSIEDMCDFVVNPRIVDFMNILQEVTDGHISAIQAVPYGRIIRI